jgi:hypothetical protein
MSAYQGRYKIRGGKIDYWDDTGFTADGELSMAYSTMAECCSTGKSKSNGVLNPQDSP